MAGVFGKFRNNRAVSGTTDFLQSNSLVAKVCFLILVIILFIIAVKLGTRFLQWLVTPTGSPILINGLRDGKKMAIIEQDPRIPDSIPIQRSVNEREGIVLNTGKERKKEMRRVRKERHEGRKNKRNGGETIAPISLRLGQW